MAKQIDYYFYSASPFTYLGHDALKAVADKNGATIAYKPVNLFGIWEVSGAVPPGQRPPVRQRMRFIELQRFADYRNLPVTLKPAHFPVDATLADCCVIALMENGTDPHSFIKRLCSGVWANDLNIADEDVLSTMLQAEGADASAVLAQAKSDGMTAIRNRNTQEAIAADAPGVPAYVLNGECFWGQDRIEYLDLALQSGRAPFTGSL